MRQLIAPPPAASSAAVASLHRYCRRSGSRRPSCRSPRCVHAARPRGSRRHRARQDLQFLLHQPHRLEHLGIADRTAPASNRRLISKVISPGVLTNSASQMLPLAAAFATRLPAASERAVSSKPAGSTATPRGRRQFFKGSAQPPASPPPEQPSARISACTPRSRNCSASSRPRVPGRNDAAIVVRCASCQSAFRAATAPAMAARSSRSRSYSTTSAPSRRVPSIWRAEHRGASR